MNPIGLVPELYCSNLEATLAFYVGVLGFKINYQRDEEKFVYLEKNSAHMMFEQTGTGRNWITGKLERPYGRGINFQIEVEQIDEFYKNIQERNIAIFMPMEEKWYRRNQDLVGNKQFLVQDPDGYLLRFYELLGVKPA